MLVGAVLWVAVLLFSVLFCSLSRCVGGLFSFWFSGGSHGMRFCVVVLAFVFVVFSVFVLFGSFFSLQFLYVSLALFALSRLGLVLYLVSRPIVIAVSVLLVR